MPGALEVSDGRAGRWRRRLQTLGAVLALLLLSSAPVVADEVESDKSLDLVQQAVALIVNDGGAERALEKAQDALEAPDPRGVDLTVVQQAVALLQRDPDEAQLQQARELLLQAAPTLTESPVSEMATGAETGTTQVIPEFRPARGVTSAGDAVLVALGLLLVAAGLWLSHRWRPPHTSRELRRAAGTVAPVDQEASR